MPPAGTLSGRREGEKQSFPVSDGRYYLSFGQPFTEIRRLRSRAAYAAENGRISSRRKPGYSTSIGLRTPRPPRLSTWV